MRTHIANLPDADLAYLKEGTRHYEEYIEAVGWAQRFALTNREVMMYNLVQAVPALIPSLHCMCVIYLIVRMSRCVR